MKRKLPGHFPIVGADSKKRNNQDWDQQDGDPRTLQEFGESDNEQSQPCRQRADTVCYHFELPVGAAFSPPVHDHSALRECKCQECSNSKKRDQRVHVTLKSNNQDSSCCRKHENPINKYQPVP